MYIDIFKINTNVNNIMIYKIHFQVIDNVRYLREPSEKFGET